MTLERIDHAVVGVARLPAYARRPRRQEWLEAILAEVQVIEDAILAMYAQGAIADAVGAQLDQLGAIVLIARDTMGDDVYRRAIRAKIAVNRSRGLLEDVIRVARLVINDSAATVTVGENGGGAIAVDVGALPVDLGTARDMARFAALTVSAGVRTVTRSSQTTPAGTFTLDGPAGLGFVTVPTLSLATLTASGFDTVVGIRPEWLDANGNGPPDLTFTISDGSLGLNDISPDIEVSGGVGADTIADIEHEIGGSEYLFVVSPSTVSGVITSGDLFTAESASTIPGAAGGVMRDAL